MKTRNIVLICIAAMLTIMSVSHAQKKETAPKTEKLETDDLRDPFWPRDYWPQKKEVIQSDSWPVLRLTSIASGASGNIAMLSGIKDPVETGDIIEKAYGGLVYRWKVNLVTSKGIDIKKLDVKRGVIKKKQPIIKKAQ